ncbi:MAG TPA: ABC transporter permease, partial [Thermomicrobiales bacterium]|nr:ABC transporter permease [Thermomicrobiales bacterium]
MTTSNLHAPTSTPAKPTVQRRPDVKSHPIQTHRGLMLSASLRSALGALWANRLRSLLTILGVIVGVAAVIAVVTLTQGTSAVLNARVAGLGTNVLTITPGSSTTGGARGGA